MLYLVGSLPVFKRRVQGAQVLDGAKAPNR